LSFVDIKTKKRRYGKMKKIAILSAAVIIVGVMFSSAWAQSIEDIYWTPTSPVAGKPITFHVKVSNPGPTAPICIRLLTPGGTPVKQTHPGIGVGASIDVVFAPVIYVTPGTYEVTAQIMDKGCKKLIPRIPYRTERITIGAPTK
jgi:hypothetical protein